MKRKKLKIAIFHLAFVYSGGGEKLVLKEYDLLKKFGHKVDIYTSSLSEYKCYPDTIKRYRIKEFLPYYIFPHHESFRVILSSILFPLLAKKFKRYDLVFAANQPSPWMAFVIKKMYKMPYVSYLAQPTRFLYPRKVDRQTGMKFVKKADGSWSVALMKVFRPLINYLDKISIKNSNVVLTNGLYIKKLIDRIYAVNSLNCPAGADRTNSKQKVFDFPYLLITNRHFPQKKFDIGIKAFAKITSKFPKLKLVITGKETDYTQTLIDLAKRLKIEDKVIFIGYVKEKQLQLFYKNAKAYLYTAPEEDFGMGVVEAMGYGIPVVASNKCGPSKIIQNNINGILVSKNSPEGFKKALTKILSDNGFAKNLSKHAKEEFVKKYIWKHHLEILTKAFKMI